MPDREIQHFLVQPASVSWIRNVAYVTANGAPLAAQKIHCIYCKQWVWALPFCGHCGEMLPYL